MRRRDFVLTSGSAILTGLATSNLHKPAVGINFELSTSDKDPSKVRSILVDFETLEITPQYLNENKNMNVQAKLEVGNQTKTSDELQTSVKNGTTKQLENDIDPIAIDGINTDNSIRGTVTVLIDHPNIKDKYAKTFTFASGNIPDSTLTQNLVAWYRFENGDARDYTAILNAKFADTTPYNGTANGATYQSTGGVSDFQNGTESGSYLFDSSGDEIASIGTIYDDQRKFTINLWIKPNSPDNIESVINNYEGGSEQSTIRVRKNGEIQWYNRDSSLNSINYKGGTINAGNWYMITAVRDGSETRLYIDTSRVGIGSNSNIGQTVGNNNFQIGNQPASDQPFDGYIDDVRFYNSVLTGTEMTDIYNQTKP
jgi:hypothetical protein